MCTRYCCSVPGAFLYAPSVSLLTHTFPLLPLSPHLPLTDQYPPSPNTESPPVPPVPFLTPHTGLTVIAYQCTVQRCSGIAEFIPPSSGTPPPPLPLLPRFTSTYRQVSSTGAALSDVLPPDPGTPLGPYHVGGDHQGL